MSGSAGIFNPRHTRIHKPGRRLMHNVPLLFVKRKVTGHGRRGGGGNLNLTSMIDFLMTVVIFLLSTFSTQGEASIPKEVQLPNAKNVQNMLLAPMVGVAGKTVYLDSKPAGDVGDAYQALEDGRVAQPVKLELLESKLKFMKETWKSSHPEGMVFPGIVILQLDEKLPAFIVKSIFYTCAIAGYTNISFMVNRRGGGSAPGAEGGAKEGH